MAIRPAVLFYFEGLLGLPSAVPGSLASRVETSFLVDICFDGSSSFLEDIRHPSL